MKNVIFSSPSLFPSNPHPLWRLFLPLLINKSDQLLPKPPSDPNGNTLLGLAERRPVKNVSNLEKRKRKLETGKGKVYAGLFPGCYHTYRASILHGVEQSLCATIFNINTNLIKVIYHLSLYLKYVLGPLFNSDYIICLYLVANVLSNIHNLSELLGLILYAISTLQLAWSNTLGMFDSTVLSQTWIHLVRQSRLIIRSDLSVVGHHSDW